MIDSFKGRWFFLSNFYPCEINYQGIVYPSVEHYYVAMKIKEGQIIDGQFYTLEDTRQLVSRVLTPGQVKRMGRGFKLRSDWDSIRLKVMEFGLREKFKIKNLQELLLQTGDEMLIEGNYWHDTWWGVCTCNRCNNKGENNLGNLLMKIRNDIKKLQI